MYINSINDRQELGFSCIKDIDAIKQLSNLKSTLKNPVSWVIRKGKQSVVLIFSKEVLVAVLIYVESISNIPLKKSQILLKNAQPSISMKTHFSIIYYKPLFPRVFKV